MAAQKNPRAPEFGKWESDVLYTAYFERPKKVNAGVSDNKPADPPLNPGRVHASSRTHATREPTIVRQSHRESPKATAGEYPARPDRQTRPEVGPPRRMVPNQSHPHRDIGYQGDVEYRPPSNPIRPRVVGGVPHPPPSRDRSSESGFGAGSMPPPAPGRSRPRPFPEGERTPIPKFGDWNVNSDYGFTQVFDKLSDQKKTGHSSAAASEAPEPETPSYSSDNIDIVGRPKKRWWSLWCSSW